MEETNVIRKNKYCLDDMKKTSINKRVSEQEIRWGIWIELMHSYSKILNSV